MFGYAPPNGYAFYAEPRKVALQNGATGLFLHAKSGEVYVGQSAEYHDAHFHIKHLYDDLVEVKTHHGHYLACNGGQVYIAHFEHEYETKFHLEHYNGQLALRVNYHNKYVGVGFWDFGSVRAHHEVTENELFNEIPLY